MKQFGEWTLTKEEMPPDPSQYGDHYLCTVENNQVVAMKYVKARIRNKEIIRWEYMGSPSIPWNVFAFMPFPKAYSDTIE